MLSMKIIEKNKKQEKTIINLSENTMVDLVQLSSTQSNILKGNIIDRIREMNKNVKYDNCFNC